jgi:ABC-type lipoprotein release transport system permease subunit
MGLALIISMMIATSGVISGFSIRIFGITEKAGESTSLFIQSRTPGDGIPFHLPSLINHTNIEQVLPVAETSVSLLSDTGSSHLDVVGLNISEFLTFYSNAEIFAGRVPQLNGSNFECLLGIDVQSVVSSSEIDIVNLSQNLNVVGLVQNVKEFQRAIIVELEDFSKLFNQKSVANIYSRIKIQLKNGRFADETIESLETLLKDYLSRLIIKREQQAHIFTESLFSDIISQLNLFYAVLLIIMLIRIFHAFSWFIQKYERDFLIMRSLGLSSFQLITLVIFLAGLIGNAGIFMGFLFGILIPSLIFTILALFYGGGLLIPEFVLSNIIPLLVLSNIVTLVAAIYPAISITQKSPSRLSLLTHGLDR